MVPGLDVVVSGGPGQLTETYIRGAESGRTLVMINGMEINDAMSIGRSVDFSQLTVDNVEHIEILRGPESAVFGSGAMGGVINIITKKGTTDWKATADLSGGKYTTWNAAASAAGMISGWDASVGAPGTIPTDFPRLRRRRPFPTDSGSRRGWLPGLDCGCQRRRRNFTGLECTCILPQRPGIYGIGRF